MKVTSFLNVATEIIHLLQFIRLMKTRNRNKYAENLSTLSISKKDVEFEIIKNIKTNNRSYEKSGISSLKQQPIILYYVLL